MAVKPPRPRGPHLNAMRCFETAARLGGFAAAAEELSVTSGAVSQQVKSLEDWIGAALFERRSQGVALTALGDQVAGEFSLAFDALGGALHNLRVNVPDAPINVAALPAIAQLWLSPRLQEVRARFPELSLSITALEQSPNLAREVFDVSLFFGVPTGATNQIVLAEDEIFPVCTPDMAKSIHSVETLLRYPLILDSTWGHDWSDWLAHVKHPNSNVSTSANFSLYSLALEATRSGAGVMMGHACLVEKDLEQGTLVAPLKMSVTTGKSLILETPVSVRAGSRLADIVKILRA